jgi:hypothetical protein
LIVYHIIVNHDLLIFCNVMYYNDCTSPSGFLIMVYICDVYLCITQIKFILLLFFLKNIPRLINLRGSCTMSYVDTLGGSKTVLRGSFWSPQRGYCKILVSFNFCLFMLWCNSRVCKTCMLQKTREASKNSTSYCILIRPFVPEISMFKVQISDYIFKPEVNPWYSM